LLEGPARHLARRSIVRRFDADRVPQLYANFDHRPACMVFYWPTVACAHRIAQWVTSHFWQDLFFTTRDDGPQIDSRVRSDGCKRPVYSRKASALRVKRRRSGGDGGAGSSSAAGAVRASHGRSSLRAQCAAISSQAGAVIGTRVICVPAMISGNGARGARGLRGAAGVPAASRANFTRSRDAKSVIFLQARHWRLK
jgi:hypothetical protein